MVSYTENKLLSITDFTKSISKILGNLKEHSLEKVGVLKNNKLEAVVISTQEYERWNGDLNSYSKNKLAAFLN